MSAVYSRFYVHLVWSTKERRAVLDPVRARRVHGYLDRLCRNRECIALAVGGVEDHVHLLVGLRPTVAVCDLVRELKVATSPFIRRSLRVDGFAWQTGYGVFSVREHDLDIVRSYIRTQPLHHASGTIVHEWELPTPAARGAGDPMM